MKKAEHNMWIDCFGNKHCLEQDLINDLDNVDMFVAYNNSIYGTFLGVYYDDYHFYYGIEQIDGKDAYCDSTGTLELVGGTY